MVLLIFATSSEIEHLIQHFHYLRFNFLLLFSHCAMYDVSVFGLDLDKTFLYFLVLHIL